MIIRQRKIFTNEECQTIIFGGDKNIRDWDLNDRKYDSESIEFSEDTKWIFERLKDFFETETELEISKIKQQINLHKFKKGDWFGLHDDVRANRLYAVGVLLNDNFEGGDFNLYNPSVYTLNKVIGNSYIFDVRIKHEITPILDGDRHSLLWFLQNEHLKMEKDKLI
jgi:hypothetical protein